MKFFTDLMRSNPEYVVAPCPCPRRSVLLNKPRTSAPRGRRSFPASWTRPLALSRCVRQSLEEWRVKKATTHQRISTPKRCKEVTEIIRICRLNSRCLRHQDTQRDTEVGPMQLKGAVVTCRKGRQASPMANTIDFAGSKRANKKKQPSKCW